jgi:hypothetical protein
MRRAPFIALTLGLVFLVYGSARAQAEYLLQPIVKRGDPVGDGRLKANGPFFVGALNGRGQILFVADDPAGGQLLVQYSDGKLIPIVAAGQDAPGGKWSASVSIPWSLSMNQQGNAVFAADLTQRDKTTTGLFRWDYQAQRVSMVALPGTPAVNGLSFEAGGDPAPVINNRDEIAFPSAVRTAAGAVRYLVFFLGKDTAPQPLVLPDQRLSNGDVVDWAWYPSLNDSGIVTFLSQRHGDQLERPYLWDQSVITSLPINSLRAPTGELLIGFTGAWANNKNRNILLGAVLHSLSVHAFGLYLLVDGQIVQVAVPGQTMPGGGKFLSLYRGAVSAGNDAGQYAFIAELDSGATAAYLMDADGKLSLVLKSGMKTNLGTVTNVGLGSGASMGVGLNSKGQIALTIDYVKGAETVVLLTPSTP